MQDSARKTVPALVPVARGALLCDRDGTIRPLNPADARAAFVSGAVLVAGAAFVAGRLKIQSARPPFDLLELFAFVHPATPCIPSAGGVAAALGLPHPVQDEEKAISLWRAARRLFEDIAAAPDDDKAHMRALAMSLAKVWRWAPMVLTTLGEPEKKQSTLAGFEVWKALEEWEDEALPGKPGSKPVEAEEARARLQSLVGAKGEARPEQVAFCTAATSTFAPRQRAGAPNIALIEAGTGTGKTLGYLAPASLWAEKNGPGLWISTYTRNLQRQILQEIGRLYPDPVIRRQKAVVRKGRENYLCLLNFEDAVRRTVLTGGPAQVALALIARWVRATEDGDISGAGFPAFLATNFPLREVSDRRGECIYAGCAHYRRCFIEKVVRRARSADIVVANHALVIARNVQDGPATGEEGGERAVRFVFDEGHHLFDAADSGFSAALSGFEMMELRRWLRGPEGRGSRARGLAERLKDYVTDDPAAREILDEAVSAAHALAGDGFLQHLGTPRGAGEAFLAEIYQQVRAQSSEHDGYYSLECEPLPAAGSLIGAAEELQEALKQIAVPLNRLARLLRTKLDDEAGTLEPSARLRIESHARGLERRARQILPAWIAMLESLASGEVIEDFADWFEIVREDGRDLDVGMQRHWVDPSKPFAEEVLSSAHGVLITSATLRDEVSQQEESADWQSAEQRTGAHHLPVPPGRFSFGSPFSYASQSRIFVVRDVGRRDIDALSAAFRELFLAAGGGALGLFTAVRTLKGVETRLREPLASAGLTLYAQHIDRLDTGALVDLFRSEENACLLGTDALRDGVDVPGRSLRLVVFDKVPWPKPTILHKARRTKFGRSYDDLITRLRLKQAFGRLIRSGTDKGCFVILEGATPSRLLAALPPDAPVLRCGLAEAVSEIRTFLAETPALNSAGDGSVKEMTFPAAPAITPP